MSFNLKSLAEDHDYYCSDSNYYSKEAYEEYENFNAFFKIYSDSDIDLNLIFRWDVHQNTSDGTYFVEVFVIQQRKGKFVPIRIHSIAEEDVPRFVELISMHWKKLQRIWSPISQQNGRI